MRVGIVGGGFTGLACASELLNKGADVAIFERRDQLGGLAAGFREPEWQSSLEYFYHHWFKSDAFVRRYLSLWNVQDNMVFRRPVTVTETESHGFVQLDSPVSLLKYPELNMIDKIRMGIALAYVKTLRDWHPLEQQTAQAWCEKYMGKRGFDALWRPLLVGKFGEERAGQVNMAWFWSRLACRTPELGTYQGGFGKLFSDVEPWFANKGAQLYKSCGNLKISREGKEWIVAHHEQVSRFDQLVVAAGPDAFQKLCGEFAPEYAKSVSQRAALGAQVVILSLTQPLGSHYWYSLRKGPQKPFLALIEHTNFVPASEFAGENLVYLADYVDVVSSDWQRSNERLVELALETCRRVNPAITKEHLKRSWVFREAYAQPVVGVNASQQLPPTRVPGAENLYHASMSHVYPWDRGTNFALELGEQVAREMLF